MTKRIKWMSVLALLFCAFSAWAGGDVPADVGPVEALGKNPVTWVGIVGAVIALGVMIAKKTKTKKDDKFWAGVSNAWNRFRGKAPLIAVLLLAVGSISGCSTWFGGDEASAYDSGYEVVELYVVARPFIEAEHRAVIGGFYDLAVNTPDLVSLTDDLLMGEIAALFDDASPEELTSVLVVYQKAKRRLLEQIDLNPELPRDELLDEFFRGISDAVAFYGLRNDALGAEDRAWLDGMRSDVLEMKRLARLE